MYTRSPSKFGATDDFTQANDWRNTKQVLVLW